MKKKKNMVMIISMIVLTLIIIASSSYAFFELTVNNDNAARADITARHVKIEFNDGPIINLDGALPGQTFIKTFSVKNTGGETTNYAVSLVDVINEFTNKEDMVYEITSTNGGGIVSETPFPDSNEVLLESVSIPVNTTQEYTMTIRYINRSYDQNIDMGKKITGTLKIVEGLDSYNITGKALDSNGNLLTSGYVEVHSKVIRSNINSDGSFTLNNVPVGEHTIFFYSDDNQLIKSQEFELVNSNGATSSVSNNTIKGALENQNIDILFELKSNVQMTSMPDSYTISFVTNNGTVDKSILTYFVGKGAVSTNITANEYYRYDSVICTNNQTALHSNGVITLDNVTSDTICTINFIDNVAPTLTIGATTASNSVELNVTATDNVGVASYKYGKSAVNSTTCSPTISSSSNRYTFNNLDQGTYTFCAVAIDEAGNESVKSTITKTWGENIHITLNIPAAGSTKYLSDSFTGISNAIVYIDGQKQSDYKKSYSFTTAGKHAVDIYPLAWNSVENMFNGCQYITSIKFNDLNTHTNFTSLKGMFQGCTNLEYVDLSSFDKITSNITTMAYMFKNCSNIESIDMSKVNLSKVDNIESMFEGCSELFNVVLGSTRSKELTSMSNVISGTESLCHFNFNNFVIDFGTSGLSDVQDCDNKDFVLDDDADSMVVMYMGCHDVYGRGNGYYHKDMGSCEKSCSLSYERACVSTCPSYTSKVGNTCVRTREWYMQFEP